MTAKKQTNELMKRAKESISLGGVSMTGMGVMGAMGSIPGMPAASGNITGTVGSSLGLLNVGQLSKNAMSLTDILTKKKKR